MSAPNLETAALLVYILGLFFLFLSMVLDVYLSLTPQLLVLVGALGLYGFTWKALAAFALPHVAGLVLLLLRNALFSGSGKKTARGDSQQTPSDDSEQTPPADGEQTPSDDSEQTPPADGEQTPSDDSERSHPADGEQTPPEDSERSHPEAEMPEETLQKDGVKY